MKPRRALALLLRLSGRDLWSTLYILVVVVTAEVLVRTAPLPRVLRAFGVAFAAAAAGDSTGPPPALSAREVRHLRSLRRIMRDWRLANGPCLREALVAGRVLRRHRPVLVLGVAGDRLPMLSAHAWLEIGGYPIGEATGFARLHE